MLEILGDNMNESYCERPHEKLKELMVCQVFLMGEVQRYKQVGDNIPATVEESWLRAVTTLTKTELGLDEFSPAPPNESLLEFINTWSKELKKVLDTATKTP